MKKSRFNDSQILAILKQGAYTASYMIDLQIPLILYSPMPN